MSIDLSHHLENTEEDPAAAQYVSLFIKFLSEKVQNFSLVNASKPLFEKWSQTPL